MNRLLFPLLLLSSVLLLSTTAPWTGEQAWQSVPFTPDIPRTWDSAALADFDLPLATPKASPIQVSPAYYYQLPERVIYKSYPVYAPGREPKGYWEWLHQQEPEIIFDPGKLKTEADWIKAGELVFDAPVDTVGNVITMGEVRGKELYELNKTPLTAEGIMPFTRYVVPKKGLVVLGSFACAMCHTRVMPDGSMLKGAQTNFPDSRRTAFAFRNPAVPERAAQGLVSSLMAAPWLPNDPHTALSKQSKETIAAAIAAMPPGVNLREGAGILYPPQVPSLIGIKDQKFLDHTGVNQHRSIGDLMRYAALNQAMDMLASYDGFIPGANDGKTLPAPGKAQAVGTADRYSDAQLYALAKFVYALKPPPNPNRPNPLTKRGELVFAEQGCVTCHTPPLFTNNMLTPVDGFTIPEAHHTKYPIFDVSVGTNPDYALKTRRGTGYYKVPSLRGIWYRSPFMHDGSLATVDDVFDPRRLRDDYVPTGFKRADVKTQAVRGHEFGMELPAKDRQALTAYLKTL
ncbi:hypothetical protein [Spirosoma luteum]|uniref:hypothetical protein n=1 Tax=Spirosoma luteum TaxID=431553 RepID=UPI001FE23152|nr:hypothetical protein [Spirosoma luteum]